MYNIGDEFIIPAGTTKEQIFDILRTHISLNVPSGIFDEWAEDLSTLAGKQNQIIRHYNDGILGSVIHSKISCGRVIPVILLEELNKKNQETINIF